MGAQKRGTSARHLGKKSGILYIKKQKLNVALAPPPQKKSCARRWPAEFLVSYNRDARFFYVRRGLHMALPPPQPTPKNILRTPLAGRDI